MKRRNILPALAASAAAAFPQSSAAWPNPFAKSLRDSFAEHWKDTKEYSLAMLDAMPADGFTSKPDPAQRIFGDQMLHICLANLAYFKAFNIMPAPAELTAPPKEQLAAFHADKQKVRQFMVASFDWIAAVLNKMTEKDLTRTDITLFRGKPHSGTDILFRAYMHTAHHRGQAVVYLRVKGITPPTWKFEPTTG